MARFNITGLDHVVLNVGDIDRSLTFYIEILGLKGERLDEFKAGKVGFPSVRIDAETLIDLFPAKNSALRAAGEKT
ncbi:MAG TPA: VOC family protein, partial [Candidatus Binatia bacterium]|nr:VOC family protein [Candidatus Binatia bacterium]